MLAAQRLERLEAELKAARLAERAARERQARIAGAAAIAALSKHPELTFRSQLLDWLRLTVTKPIDRTEIAPLLVAALPPANSPTSSALPDAPNQGDPT